VCGAGTVAGTESRHRPAAIQRAGETGQITLCHCGWGAQHRKRLCLAHQRIDVPVRAFVLSQVACKPRSEATWTAGAANVGVRCCLQLERSQSSSANVLGLAKLCHEDVSARQGGNVLRLEFGHVTSVPRVSLQWRMLGRKVVPWAPTSVLEYLWGRLVWWVRRSYNVLLWLVMKGDGRLRREREQQ